MATTTFVVDALPKQERASHARPGADVLGRKPGYVVPESDRQPIVTYWTGMTDYENAPPSYGVFFKQYWDYTKWYVRQFNVPESSLEDLCMELMTRFMERDSIGVFDRQWDNRSKTGKSVFRTYYTHFLLAYTPGKKRNFARVTSHELLLWDAVISDDGGVTTWGDLNGSVSTVDPEVELGLMVDDIRAAVSDEDVAIVDKMIDLALGSTRQLKRTDVVRELGVKPDVAEAILARFTEVVEAVAVHGLRGATRSPAEIGDMTLSEFSVRR